MTTGPFFWMPSHRKLPVMIAAIAVAAILLAALMVVDQPLRTPAAPNGIVSFELAGSLDNSRQIIDSWSIDAKVAAGMSLGLDYLFLLIYAAAIAMGCELAAQRTSQWRPAFGRLGMLLAWSQLIAAACDMVENLLLFILLQGSTVQHLPALARGCALVKFSLVGAGLLYIGSGGLMIMAMTRSRIDKHDGDAP